MGLTKEEKKALKLAKKLEKAKKEDEDRKARKREELERELAASELQRVKLEERLKKLMVKSKEPVYKQDIQVMCHVFDRAMDKKDALIDLIMQLKRTADDQYQKTISSFCEVVDRIVGTFLADLDTMCKDGEEKTNLLLQQDQEDRNYIMEYQRNAETHMNILLYHSHELSDNLAWTIRGENYVKIDEDTNKYLAIRVDLRSFLEGIYSATWEEFKKTLKGYISGTAENQKQVRLLKQKELMMADIIAHQAKKIVTTQGLIRRLRNELTAYETGTKQAGFRDRRNRHKIASVQLKKRFNEGILLDEKQLNTLVTFSNDSVKYLEDAFKKVERILRIAALCRKLETLEEKVLPFGSKVPQNLEQVSRKTSRRSGSEDSLVVNAISTTCGLTRLWKRISKAELSKKALYREKMLLQEDNSEMMRILQMRGSDKFSAKAFECQCSVKCLQRSKNQPHAVEGSLELRKIMNYY